MRGWMLEMCRVVPIVMPASQLTRCVIDMRDAVEIRRIANCSDTLRANTGAPRHRLITAVSGAIGIAPGIHVGG
ncbi:hypothetical protein [Reyranella sp. CPCC 100927]|uniref:hypothetical protein n=1 Tax=Reyranella sp. CPCC 100927 TaxID=2599616 RepID=UPI0015B48CC4|nr:hypothetical protein [Reyranella sp. CPCC 100927]